MPELPEVEALARFVAANATGSTIERVDVAALSALKTFDPPVYSLAGREVLGCERRGKYLCIRVSGGSWLVVHLALGGWLQWHQVAPSARPRLGKGPLALRVTLSGGKGFDITEQGTEKRLAIWVVGDPLEVEGIARLGPDPLADGFDPAVLKAVLAGRGGNLKSAVTDQSALAGIGNAYSDEALHAARLSPFKPAGRLSDAEVERLHAALVGVLSAALERSSGTPARGLKSEKKAALAVHGRTGMPCPVCGDTIREVAFATRSLQYCPTCQTGGKPLADRRLSRLIK